jgi:hypothetical protein
MLSVLIFILALFILSAPSAFAYLDPGAGSSVLAILMGGASGVLIIWYLFKEKIRSVFKLNKNKE